jgi:hypothetical protein
MEGTRARPHRRECDSPWHVTPARRVRDGQGTARSIALAQIMLCPGYSWPPGLRHA